jgi:hypothetical protein
MGGKQRQRPGSAPRLLSSLLRATAGLGNGPEDEHLRGAVDVAVACLEWVEDTGACHLCGLGALPAIARARFTREKQRQTEHDEDCPVLLLERALEADRG